MKIGYARVSSAGQSLEAQLEILTAAGCDKIFSEKKSGRSAADRAELAKALEHVRNGDTLIVTRLDRLARSVTDLHRIVAELEDAGVAFQCLQQGGVDTSTSTGKLTLAILGAVAEFENDIRRERQRDGIQRAKEKGIYSGGKRQIQHSDATIAARAAAIGPAAAARELGIARASVYRAIARVNATEATNQEEEDDQ